MATTRGMDGKIFFIYDHSFLKKEADDLKDAIVYFSPQTMDLDSQCALCGQLMGMVGFFRAMTSSAPKCFTLHRNKFAVSHFGRYSVALSGDPCEPDPVLHRQLVKLYHTFCFYHGTLHQMYESCNGERIQFLGRIIHIWDYLLPACRYYGDTFNASFDSIPTVELPKSGAAVYLRASHLLQLSQEKPGILAGCLIFKNRVLSSQLPADITARLLMLKAQGQDSQDLHFPCQQLNPEFSLPKGVRIVCVYLTPQEYLSLYASNKCHSTNGTGFGHTTVPQHSHYSSQNGMRTDSEGTGSSSQRVDSEGTGSSSQRDDSEGTGSSSQRIDSEGTGSSQRDDSEGTGSSSQRVDSEGTGSSSLRVSSEGNGVSWSSSQSEKSSSSTLIIHSSEYTEYISDKKSTNAGKNGPIPAVFDQMHSLVTSEENNQSSNSSQERSMSETGQGSGDLGDSQNSMLDVRWTECHMTHINRTPISTPRPDEVPEHSSENVSCGSTSDTSHVNISNCSLSSVSDEHNSNKESMLEIETANDLTCNDSNIRTESHSQTAYSGEAPALNANMESSIVMPKSPSVAQYIEQDENESGKSEDKEYEKGVEDKEYEKGVQLSDITVRTDDRADGNVENTEQTKISDNRRGKCVEMGGPSTHLSDEHDSSQIPPVQAVTEEMAQEYREDPEETNKENDNVNPETDAGSRDLEQDTETGCNKQTSDMLQNFDLELGKENIPVTICMNSPLNEKQSCVTADADSVSRDSKRVDCHTHEPNETNVLSSTGSSSHDEALSSPASAFLCKGTQSMSSPTPATEQDPTQSNSVPRESTGNLDGSQYEDAETDFSPASECVEVRSHDSNLKDAPPRAERNLSEYMSVDDQCTDPLSQIEEAAEGDLSMDSSSRKPMFYISPSPFDMSRAASKVQTPLPHFGDPAMDSEPQLHAVDLYIQRNSDMILMLLLHHGTGLQQDTVRPLWKIALPQLGDIECQLKECIYANMDNKAPPMDYNYLQYNKYQRALKGNQVTAVSVEENEFLEASVLMHEDFLHDPLLNDIVLRSHRSSIYGHHAVDYDTYFQVLTSQRGSSGAPFDRDPPMTLQQRAQKRLLRDHKINLI